MNFQEQITGWRAILKKSLVWTWDRGVHAGTGVGEAERNNQSPAQTRIPNWHLRAVPLMMNDEYVQHGLLMIEGPITSNTRVAIVAGGTQAKTSRVERSAKKQAPPSPFGGEETDPTKPPKPNPAKAPVPPKGESMAAPPFIEQEETPVEEEEVEDPNAPVDEETFQGVEEPTGLPPEVEAYIADNVDLLIDNCLEAALTCVRYGFAPTEVCYDFEEGIPYLHHLETINPFEAEPLVDPFGRFDGIKVQTSNQPKYLKDFLGYPKAFWPVHRRHIDRWYGQSRLKASYPKFWDKWSKKGLQELMRIWITKCAFDVGGFYYDDKNPIQVNGVKVTNTAGHAANMLLQTLSGSGFVLPGSFDPVERKRVWERIQAQMAAPPGILLESVQDCDARILLAMGVSPELVQNFQTGGMGSASGRAIPETAFYSMLRVIIQAIMNDFKEQIMDKLLFQRFKRRFHYRLVVLPLAGDDQSSSTDPKPMEASEAPGGAPGGLPGQPAKPPTPEQKNAAMEFGKNQFGKAA